MQVLIAYAFDRDPSAGEAAAGIERVENHYRPLFPVAFRRSGKDAGRVGLHLWDAADSPWNWPSWAEDDELSAATVYLPIGYERVIGDVAPEDAALPLARALAAKPGAVLEMTAPFSVATLEAGRSRVAVQADGLGLGRLFELRFPGGWVWTNRPVAAALFAGIRPKADVAGWRSFAASGWFMGDDSPIEGVHAVPAGSRIVYDAESPGRIASRVDALGVWAANRRGDALLPERIEAIAEGMRGLARSLSRMWPGVVASDLSGGRDSRIVVAALASAGVPMRLHTNGTEPGEADVAERLVSLLPEGMRPKEHQVNRPAATGTGVVNSVASENAMLPNALAWHRNQEGLRPATYLPTLAPAGLTFADYIAVGGASGEIAQGTYYPSDYADVGKLPRTARFEGFAQRLSASVIRRAGVSRAARQDTDELIRRSLARAVASGVDDVKMLDYFYADERLRRWGTTAERIGTITPLLLPEFVQASFDLTSEQRRADALHKAVTAALMPQWADEPYYQPPADLVKPAFRPRLGSAPDRDLVSAIVADPSVWSDAYEEPAVLKSWHLLLSGGGGPRDEELIQRVIWRTVYEDFLAEAAGESVPVRAPVAPAQLPSAAKATSPVAKARRLAARTLRKAADSADTP
jgi:hypothetical protein